MISAPVILSTLLSFSALVSAVIPDNDPFYFPPAGFENSPPGTVFKDRPSKSTISGVKATQILYRTTNAQGGAIATVATILKGPKSVPNKLVAYQVYEDAANTTCSPSYSFTQGQAGPFQPEFGSEVPNGLANGWTLVVPDYEGINSTFAAGRPSGMAVLDSIRAALQYAPAGIDPAANIGFYGYSGGAIATGWAAALSQTYAPELNIKGFAFGGTPANVTATLLKVDKTAFAGFGGGGVVGLVNAYPELQALYPTFVTPEGEVAFNKIRSQCAVDDLFQFAFQSFLTTKYQKLGPGLLTQPTVKRVLDENNLGEPTAETPKAPVLMYHSTADEVIPYESANRTATLWCSRGANIEFDTDIAGAGHAGLMLAYSKTATDWLAQRINGVPPAPGCIRKNIITLGLPLRRSDEVAERASSVTIEDIFGKADAKFVALIKTYSAYSNGAQLLLNFLNSVRKYF